MIKLIVVHNRFTAKYEVAKQPAGTGWLCDVVAEFDTVGEATDYIAELCTSGMASS